MAGACSLDGTALDALMPMHLLVGPDGVVTSAGRTIARAMGGDPVGQSLFDLVRFRRPADLDGVAGLRAAADRTLHLTLRGAGDRLVGQAVPAGGGAALLNLSFSVGLVDAVGRLSLTAGDFAPTDLAIEMLFLVEANAAALSEALALNTRLEGARIAAVEQAFTDTLTGLKNRRALDHVLRRHAADGGPFALMNVDLDWFKAVNDTFGHAAGDHVLQAAARALLGAVRSGDVVARVGGDEFVILLPGAQNPDRIGAIAQALIEAIETPVPWDGKMARISASVGIAISTDHPGGGTATVQDAADAALYASKAAGRGRWTLSRDMQSHRPREQA